MIIAIVSVDEKYNAYHKFTNGSQGDEAKYNKKRKEKQFYYQVIFSQRQMQLAMKLQ